MTNLLLLILTSTSVSAGPYGTFICIDKTLDELEANNQVIYRYCDEQGAITADANPNGAIRNIAGIRNAAGNVFGMMPHPERACTQALGNTDGRIIIQELLIAAKSITIQVSKEMANI